MADQEKHKEELFEQLLVVVGARIRTYLRWRCPALNEQDVEDIIANAAVRLWGRVDRYDTSRPLDGLFFQIAKNLAIDRLKELLRSKELPCDPEQLSALVRTGTEPKLTPESKAYVDLLEILEGLPYVDRQILMHHAHNAERNETWTDELARELGIRPGTLRVKRLRILKRVQEEMRKRGNDLSSSDSGSRDCIKAT